jgi:hypothetical protein
MDWFYLERLAMFMFSLNLSSGGSSWSWIDSIKLLISV